MRGRWAPLPMEGRVQGKGNKWRSANWCRQLQSKIHQRVIPDPPPQDQSDHRGKKRNLLLGKSCWAIFGTQTVGPPTPSPPALGVQHAMESSGHAMSVCKAGAHPRRKQPPRPPHASRASNKRRVPVIGPLSQDCGPCHTCRAVSRTQIFFLIEESPSGQPPETTNCQLPTATNHQPLPTATNRQPPTFEVEQVPGP